MLSKRSYLRLLTLAAALVVVVAACGTDDGGEVRSIGDEGGSSSASASAPAGDGSASASGVAPADTGTVSGALGGYAPVSDVSTHAKVVLDLCAINDFLPKDAPIDYDAVLALYEVGENSVKGDGSIRNIAGFARKDRDEDIWNEYVAQYSDPQWQNTFVMNAIEGTGPFTAEPDAVRRQAIQKGIQNQIMVSWTFHELVAAMGKAAQGDLDPANGAPHHWDKAWAFYHGENPDCAPYSTADKRGGNFGTGTAVNDALVVAWTQGVEGLAAGDMATASKALSEIKRQIIITYVQATIRYGHLIDTALADGDIDKARIEQVEGWAFYRVVEPFIAAVDPAAASAIAARYDIGIGAPQDGSGDAIRAAIESVYDGLGITAEDVGVLE